MAKVTVHASCVVLGDHGVLILGPPGSGKSDLVLRLIDEPGYDAAGELIRARLIADDQTNVERRGEALVASAPEAIAGLLEIRGLGIVRVPYAKEAHLVLAVRLMPASDIERMPLLEDIRFEIADGELPLISIDGVSASAPARIRAAFKTLKN